LAGKEKPIARRNIFLVHQAGLRAYCHKNRRLPMLKIVNQADSHIENTVAIVSSGQITVAGAAPELVIWPADKFTDFTFHSCMEHPMDI